MKKKPDDVDREVGAKIRIRRNLVGLSQEKLAEALGISFQQVQKYEKGINRVGASRLNKIALVLQTPVATFFESANGGGRETDGVQYLKEIYQSKECVMLAQTFLAIEDDEVRQKVLSLVRALSLSRKGDD